MTDDLKDALDRHDADTSFWCDCVAHSEGQLCCLDAEHALGKQVRARLTELSAENEALSAENDRNIEALASPVMADLRAAQSRLKRIEEAARELLAWGVVLDDERLGYIEVQVSRGATDDLRRALDTPSTPPSAETQSIGVMVEAESCPDCGSVDYWQLTRPGRCNKCGYDAAQPSPSTPPSAEERNQVASPNQSERRDSAQPSPSTPELGDVALAANRAQFWENHGLVQTPSTPEETPSTHPFVPTPASDGGAPVCAVCGGEKKNHQTLES